MSPRNDTPVWHAHSLLLHQICRLLAHSGHRADICPEMIAQEGGAALVHRVEARNRGSGVDEGFGSNRWRGE